MKVDIPQGWTRQTIEGLTSKCRSGYWGNSEASDGDQPCRVIRNGDVRKDTTVESDLPRRFLNRRQIDRAKVLGGDVILVTSGAYTGNVARIRSVNGDEPIVASNFVRLLRPGPDTHGVFLGHLLASGLAQRGLKGFIAGTAIENLQSDVYEILEFPVPPLPEQKKIAAILSSVDDAIAATRKVIEQTKRVKKGLLQALMTRGIGHTRFKKTEIGEIPEEWEVMRLESVLESRTYGISSGLSSDPIGTPILRMGNLSEGRLDLQDLKYADLSDKDPEDALVRPGDILFNRTNSVDLVGQSALVDTERELGYASYLIRLRVDGRVDPRWLTYFMNSWHGQKIIGRLIKPSVSQANVNPTALARSFFPLPPRLEQERIADVLDSHTRSIQMADERIDQLQVLKRGLMQDLLTGRVRVPAD